MTLWDIILDFDRIFVAFLKVWDCAVLTTKFLEKHAFSPLSLSPSRHDLLKKLHLTSGLYHRPIQVLELGTGTVLLSICLAKMGPNIAVMSTEYGPAVDHLLRNCKRNKMLQPSNASSSAVHTTTLTPGFVNCRELDWYKSTETLLDLFPNKLDTAIIDLIVVTDCTLCEKESRGVLNMICKYGTPNHTIVVAGVCKEREGTKYFVEASKQVFADLFVVPHAIYHEDYQSTRHDVLLIQV